MFLRCSSAAFLALALAFPAGHALGQDPPEAPHLCNNTHSIMSFSDAWMRSHFKVRASLPVVHASGLPTGNTFLDLSRYVDYAACGGAKGFNQGQCGNCWVFGTTVALSADDGAASGTPQLFSTQWFDSDYYVTEGQTTCNGGDGATVANWYSSHPKLIPWSNTGAGYADGKGPSVPATPASSISQNPYVGITRVGISQIATARVSQVQAIANIKSVLDNNQAVLLSFFLPQAGWTEFFSAWDQSQENAPWAGVDKYSGQRQSGGHLVCVVGYDDVAGIWLIQNSWGVTSGRPHGRFALPQAMNYAATVDGSYDQWGFDVLTPIGWSNASSSAPTILTQPASQTVAVGAAATFKVAASGQGPLAYQWYRGTAALSGAVSASYTTQPATLADNGATFHVTVSNAYGTVSSASAALTVGSSPTGPVITTQPANQTVAVGAAATFKVVATGAAPLTYQWYVGTDAIAGATAASYTTPATIAADNGATFHVVVRNAGGSVTSGNATLTVGSVPVPTDLVRNGGFESGATAWTAPSGVIGQFGSAYAGTWNAWLSRKTLGWSRSGQISQAVTIPATATQAILTFRLHVTGGSGGTLRAQVRNANGQVLATLGTFGDAAAASGYQPHTFDLSAYRGKTVQVTFSANLGSVWRSRTWTSFLLDNVSLNAK